MQERELLELEIREQEQARKNLEEMTRENKIGDTWRLYKDKFDLEKFKTCAPMHYGVPLQILPAIYEKVLFAIPTAPSPEKFKEITGCSVNQIVDWRRNGWVETILNL